MKTSTLTCPTESGDKRALTSEQQRLAAQYLPMARALAKPFKVQFPDSWEEFESAAMLALVESARSFNPDRLVKFSTFARRRIWGAMRDVRRQRVIRARRIAPTLDGAPSTVSLPEDPEARGQVLLSQEQEPVGSEYEAVEAVESWLRKLPKSHGNACRLIYINGKTHAEAAEILGISPSRVTYLHVEALAMLNGSWREKGRATVTQTNRQPDHAAAVSLN